MNAVTTRRLQLRCFPCSTPNAAAAQPHSSRCIHACKASAHLTLKEASLKSHVWTWNCLLFYAILIAGISLMQVSAQEFTSVHSAMHLHAPSWSVRWSADAVSILSPVLPECISAAWQHMSAVWSLIFETGVTQAPVSLWHWWGAATSICHTRCPSFYTRPSLILCLLLLAASSSVRRQ